MHNGEFQQEGVSENTEIRADPALLVDLLLLSFDKMQLAVQDEACLFPKYGHKLTGEWMRERRAGSKWGWRSLPSSPLLCADEKTPNIRCSISTGSQEMTQSQRNTERKMAKYWCLYVYRCQNSTHQFQWQDHVCLLAVFYLFWVIPILLKYWNQLCLYLKQFVNLKILTWNQTSRIGDLRSRPD